MLKTTLKNDRIRRKIFNHKKVDLGYEDIIAETTSTGRKYNCPNGIS